MRRFLVLWTFLFSVACLASQVLAEPDYIAIARIAVDQVEARPYELPSRELTYVVSPTLVPEARAALATIRKVVSPGEVPTSADVSLPAHYFKVQKFQVSGATALFEGVQGPIYSGNPLSCGLGISVPIVSEGGAWRTHSVRWSQC